MICTLKLLARRKIISFGVDAFKIIGVVLETMNHFMATLQEILCSADIPVSSLIGIWEASYGFDK
jgi:hypothetical protein